MKECPFALEDVALAAANDGTNGTLSIGFMCAACMGTLEEVKGREVIIDEPSLVRVTADTGLGDLLGSCSDELVNEMPVAALAGDLINCASEWRRDGEEREKRERERENTSVTVGK